MIFVDFDQTLVSTAHLDLAFGRFTAMPSEGTVLEKLAARREQHNYHHSLNLAERIDHWRGKGGVYINHNRFGDYISFARPKAYQFLQECQKLGPTYILTAGGTQFQSKIARCLNFPPVKCFGNDRYADVPFHPASILIDDLGTNTIGVQNKLIAMGVPNIGEELYAGSDRHIKIPAWFGNETEEDDELFKLLPLIEETIKNERRAKIQA